MGGNNADTIPSFSTPLSEERMKVIRQLRRQCDVLNQKHPSSKQGRKRFVVYMTV
jgi:hypothetical protein